MFNRKRTIRQLIDTFGTASVLDEIEIYLRERAEQLRNEPLKQDAEYSELVADMLASAQHDARKIQN